MRSAAPQSRAEHVNSLRRGCVMQFVSTSISIVFNCCALISQRGGSHLSQLVYSQLLRTGAGDILITRHRSQRADAHSRRTTVRACNAKQVETSSFSNVWHRPRGSESNPRTSKLGLVHHNGASYPSSLTVRGEDETIQRSVCERRTEITINCEERCGHHRAFTSHHVSTQGRKKKKKVTRLPLILSSRQSEADSGRGPLLVHVL